MFPRLGLQGLGNAVSTEDSLLTTTDSLETENADDFNFAGYSENAPDAKWWINAIDDENFFSPFTFDSTENGLWNGKFVPPPPRPPFLEDTIVSDGLTTCDLCTWARHRRNSYSLLGESIVNDTSIEVPGDLGWTFTLIIVSLVSALLGAIVMIVVLRCRRVKSNYSNGNRPLPWWHIPARSSSGNSNSEIGSRGTTGAAKHQVDSLHDQQSSTGIWTWLTNKRQTTPPIQLGSPMHHPSTAENHYTHMDDTYSPVGTSGEALYAELDRESINSNNPSYQNTAYSQCAEATDIDMPMVSSAPSSAYYSDLSITAVPTERAYEVVGLTVMSSSIPNWDSGNPSSDSDGPSTTLNIGRRHRLSAINESSTIPSDYV